MSGKWAIMIFVGAAIAAVAWFVVFRYGDKIGNPVLPKTNAPIT